MSTRLLHAVGDLQGFLLGRLHGVGVGAGEGGFAERLLKPGRDHLEPEALEQETGICRTTGRINGVHDFCRQSAFS